MTDLLDRLGDLAPEPLAPSEEAVAGDVRRGRRALARRRAIRGAAGGALLVALGGTATIVARQHGSETPPVATPSHRAPSPTAGTGHAAGIRLVDYTGDQKPGFRVQKVPEGYVLQGSNAFSLDIAKPGDHSDLSNFEGKIVIMLQSKDVALHKQGKQVSVAGHDGWLREPGDGAMILEYNDGRHNVVVQSWTSLALTDAQLVELASGVTVTAQAQAGVG